jgi:hypothetical protein
MDSMRFRPELTGLEARDTPASPGQVVAAFSNTEEISGTLRYIGAHLAEGRTTEEIEFVGRYATQLTVVSRAHTQTLGEFKADIQARMAADPQSNATLAELLERTTIVHIQSQANTLLARTVALGFGVPATTIDPVPPPTSPPPIPTGLNPTDASGMTDTFPDPNSPNFVDIGTGVKSWDVFLGQGTAVPPGGNVKVFYTLWLASNGQQVETNRTGTPLSSPLSGLIVGWQEGVPGMKPGGIRRLVIPPEKGYGAGGTATIPPNSTLVFEIKLLAP